MVCNKCGKQNTGHARFCDGCGATLTNEQPVQQSAPKTDEDNKVIFVLSYLGVLFFLPLVACPDSKVGRFHANQGLVLLIAGIAGQIVLTILSSFAPWGLWIIFSLLSMVYGLAIFILAILGMVNAYKLEQKPLPVIGTITILK